MKEARIGDAAASADAGFSGAPWAPQRRAPASLLVGRHP